MSLLKLCTEIECALRDHLAVRGVVLSRPAAGIGQILWELHRLSDGPPSARPLLDALRAINEAAHGLDVQADTVERAVALATAFLNELRLPARSG